MMRLGTFLTVASFAAVAVGQPAHAQSGSHYIAWGSSPSTTWRQPRVCPIIRVESRHLTESGDLLASRYFVGRENWGLFNRFFWRNFLQGNRGGWSDEAGFNRATDQWLPLARMYNALFALVYSFPNLNGPTEFVSGSVDCTGLAWGDPVPDACARRAFRNEPPSAQTPVYSTIYGRLAWVFSIQRGSRPSFECIGSDIERARHTHMWFDRWVNFYPAFTWRTSLTETIAERASTYFHEAVHGAGKRHDGNGCGGSCDKRFPAYNANTLQVRFLEEYTHCAVRSTSFLRERARARANAILNDGFEVETDYRVADRPVDFCSLRGY